MQTQSTTLKAPPKERDARIAQQGVDLAAWLEANLGKYECIYCGKVQQDQHVSCCGEVHFILVGG